MGYSPWGCKELDMTGQLTLLASQVAQTVRNLPAMQETQVPFLGWEDPLKKGMATHSSILAWRIPCQSTVHGVTELDITEQLTLIYTYISREIKG